jgi:hypothetical protein
MTVAQAESILLQTEIRIAVQQRFAFDTGTMLRLDNYTIVNIFDDGRYFLQGGNTEELIGLFSQAEKPWDPDSWTGEVPRHAMTAMFPAPSLPKRIDS